jgi:predicted HicB family RNase H-like nuclease
MTHTLIIRGFNDQVHEKLGEIANQRGVSINSIVKDAVDIWLKKGIRSSSETPSSNVF